MEIEKAKEREISSWLVKKKFVTQKHNLLHNIGDILLFEDIIIIIIRDFLWPPVSQSNKGSIVAGIIDNTVNMIWFWLHVITYWMT